jgi:hypothetical protein
VRSLRSFIFGICPFLIFLTMLSWPALADESATVTATIKTELVSITTNVSSLDYGIATYNIGKDLVDVLTITNNGTVNEKIEALGSDAVNRADSSKKWVLVSDTLDVNKYKHAFSLTGATPVYLSNSIYTTVSDSVAPTTAVADIHMKLVTPLAGSYSGTFDTNVVFRATKV